MRCKKRDFENRNLCWQLDHRNGIAQERARAVRAEERVLPAAPDKQAIVENLGRSLQLEQKEAEAEADAQLDNCRDLEAEYASGSPSV